MSVEQTGPITPGHVAIWTAPGVVQDGGASTSGVANSFGLYGLGGTPLVVTGSATPGPFSGQYTQLGFGVSSTAAYLTVNSFNGGATLPFEFILGGVNVFTVGPTGVTFPTGLPPSSGGTGLTATPAAGQLLIGNGTGYTLNTLTAGSGVQITNNAGAITISTYNGGGSVTSVSGSGGSTGLTLTGGPIVGAGTLTLGGTLGVTSGGTGVTSSTGAGSVVLNTSPTLASPTLNSPTINNGSISNAAITGGSVSSLTTPLGVASGGTGASSLTANAVVVGNGTGAVSTVSPGTSGNVLTSNGTTWVSSAAGGGQIQTQILTVGSGTWTAPTGVTKVFVAVVGGGGGGVQGYSGGTVAYGGGTGGSAIGEYTVAPGTGYSYTVGAGGNAVNSSSFTGSGVAGGATSFSTFISATGGGAGSNNLGNGTSGSGSSGTLRNGSGNQYVIGTPLSGPNVLYTGGLSAQVWGVTSAFFTGSGGYSDGVSASYGGISGAIYLMWVG